MAVQGAYPIEPWALRETHLDLSMLARSESLFALANGDTELQQAVRFALFHVLQAGARTEANAIPAKGLTGPGYDGHAFWDTEIFVLPLLTLTIPDATANALRWRHSTLPLARERAAQHSLKGALFPWRTINGLESSGYWPAGTAAFHISADIAHAVLRYVGATGDTAFERGPGIDLLTHTARLWLSLGHHDATGHEVWDFAATPPEKYPLLLHFPYFDLYRKQVVKQADLVLAMYICGDMFTPEQKATNFEYYEPLTVRDSSLSACAQAVMAAEVGHLELAYDYLGEAALTDLRDLAHNTRNGLHIASLAGAWIAVVGGSGGLRHRDGSVGFAPRLPQALARLAFSVLIRGRRVRVEVTRTEATYSLADGEPLEILHHEERLRLSAGKPEVPPGPRGTGTPTPEATAGAGAYSPRSRAGGPVSAVRLR